eukprot:GEZU01016452.1.p2 GENE.GEZU01016452.1~~GEZU01016452.1.p2  ORF type:complete len:150 (+),score=58.78 GEZU01016452.1:156-605(+)
MSAPSTTKVCDIMTPNPQCVKPDDTLKTCAQKMKQLDCGVLPVCEGGDMSKCVGILTDRDIVTRAIAENKDVSTTKVREIMTQNPECVNIDDDIKKAADVMRQKQIRRLLVWDQKAKKLAGVLSLADVATAAQDRSLLGDVLKRVSETH